MRDGLARRGAAGLTLLVLLAGCHVYVPTERDGLRPRDGVRVLMDRAADAGDLPGPPPEPGETIDGQVVDWNDRSLVLSVWRSDLRNQLLQYEAARQEVTLPWTGVETVERKELSWARTGALGVVLGLGFTALITMAMEDTGARGSDGSGNGGATPN